MPFLYPVPTGRTSEPLVHQRLLSQIHVDQRDLLKLQDQLSTGRRITTPSEDAPAAMRAIVLQRLLEQRKQAQENLNTSQSYLDSADTALSGVAGLLTRVRGLAITAADSSTGDVQRAALAEEVFQSVQQMMDLANQKFRGRYLFAGSLTTERPFEYSDPYVVYHGNEHALQSFADTDLLFKTNIPGAEVFGAISAEVRGTVDLNPIVTIRTRLDDLRRGEGISQGSFVVSDGTSSVTVDIDAAETIGDVIRLIEANPPAGREVTARVVNNALVVDLDDALGGNLTITEVGQGTTAAELGIFNDAGTGTSPIVGYDLDATISRTTRVADILGMRASAVVASPGSNNDLFVEALDNGVQNNGVRIQFVDDDLLRASPGLSAGSEVVNFTAVPVAAQAALTFSGTNNNLVLTANAPGAAANNIQIRVVNGGAIGNAANVSFNAVSRELTVAIDNSNGTQIQTVINAINAEGTFTAAYDASVPADGGYVPTAIVPSTAAGVLAGSTGNSGADANTALVYIDAGATTANQVVAALQADATFSASFRVQVEGKDTTAAALAGSGIVDLNATATTDNGAGENLDLTSGIQIVNAGETFTVNLSGAKTVEDLLNILNSSPAKVLAEINADGNGINLRSRVSGKDFAVGENGGTTATQLGIRSLTVDTELSVLNYGQGVESIAGTDFTITRKDGVVLDINVSGAETIGDVIDLINNHASNVGPNAVVAQLKAFGNGIEIVDANAAGVGNLAIDRTPLSSAAWDLGLVPPNQRQVTAMPGPTEVLAGDDPNPLESNGIFNALLRLREAIAENDLDGIDRAVARLDENYDTLSFSRAELGARSRGLEVLKQRHEDEDVELRRVLSNEIDTDLVEAISQMTIRQASLQASLRLIGRTLQLTLLDFI